MKRLFIPILILSIMGTSATVGVAQSAGDVLNIALSGDANTEQSAKLELIRILNERLNKLTVAQLNSRVIVSSGVTTYYKVDEIIAMHRGIFMYRSKYITKSQTLAAGNSGFSNQYIAELKAAADKATIIKDQLMVVVKSGQPIVMPAMPTFSISAGSSGGDSPWGSFSKTMEGLLSSYGVKSQDDINNLSPERRDAFNAAANAAKTELESKMKESKSAEQKQMLTLMGNIVGTMFGVPGAGTLISGVMSGGVSGVISGLVGSIVDKFQIPTDYYDSNTLKLTDSERIKIIDELHVRISELYQQVAALGASMSSETKTRYNELSQPRNDMIMYGPKK